MSSLVLKAIALISMIVDHYGAVFQPWELSFRIVGRLAFPIYCFLLVEGFFHTKNINKYGLRLAAFSIISEIPFDYAFFGGLNWSHQNVFFTLFIGLSAMAILEEYKYSKAYIKALIIVATCIIAAILKTDYSYIGILYILSFYFTYNMPKVKRLLLVFAVLYFVNMFSGSFVQQYSLLALIPLMLYSGAPGTKNKIVQILFYAAYPLHLFLFALIK
ncbi:MAG: TraX family protein [Gudongella sp.]|jgi:hypothetical protein|nr:TraX family protein [Gudongella sp.]